MDWDCLRLFDAAVQAGSLSAAARNCGLSQPTLGRRISELEHALGLVLFERRREGLILTPAGQELVPLARQMAGLADGVALRGAGLAQSLKGTVRLAAGPWFSSFMCENVSALVKDQPGIELEIVGSSNLANLSRREADIAIRNVRPGQGPYKVQRLSVDLVYALYCSRDYARAHPQALTDQRFECCDFIGWDESHRELKGARWLAERIKGQPRFRAATSTSFLDMALAGAGIALMPRYSGDRHTSLLRVQDAVDFGAERQCIVIHRDTVRLPHVRAVRDNLLRLVESKRLLLSPAQ